MNFRCQNTRELLEALEDGELEPREKARALHHLASCTECRAVRESSGRALSATRAALAAHPRIAAPRGFDAGVWAAIAQREQVLKPVTRTARMLAFVERPIPRLFGSAMFGLLFALAFGGVATRASTSGAGEPQPFAPTIPASLPPDSMAALCAMERQRLSAFGHGPQAGQLLPGDPNRPRRSMEEQWKPNSHADAAFSSGAGSLC